MFSARPSALERRVDQAIYWDLKFGKEVLFLIASGTARSGMAGDRFSHSGRMSKRIVIFASQPGTLGAHTVERQSKTDGEE